MKVFVVAMPKEANAIRENFELHVTANLFGFEVTRGLIHKEESAIVVSGVGKSNAAAATMLAIAEFKPEAIINIGLAGGLDSTLQPGFIVKVNKVVQSDFNLCGVDGVPIGTIDDRDSPFFRLNGPFTERPVVCATNDRFISDMNDALILRRTFCADVCDMELGAIAHVCSKAFVPLYSWKVISDMAAGSPPPIQYRQNMERGIWVIKENAAKLYQEVGA